MCVCVFVCVHECLQKRVLTYVHVARSGQHARAPPGLSHRERGDVYEQAAGIQGSRGNSGLSLTLKPHLHLSCQGATAEEMSSRTQAAPAAQARSAHLTDRRAHSAGPSITPTFLRLPLAYPHANVYTHIYTYTPSHTHIHTHTQMSTLTHTNTRIHTYTPPHTHTHTYIYIHLSLH